MHVCRLCAQRHPGFFTCQAWADKLVRDEKNRVYPTYSPNSGRREFGDDIENFVKQGNTFFRKRD